MGFFNRKEKDVSENVNAIKTWVSDIYNVDENGNVSVKEIQCCEDNCPHVETVILIKVGYVTNMLKIKKPLIYLKRYDIETSRIAETTISKE